MTSDGRKRCSDGGKIGGKISGPISGRKAAASGQIARLGALASPIGLHVRWHSNRKMFNSDCDLCVAELNVLKT
jgi:hypothetical protein